jgi:hypothetical protein
VILVDIHRHSHLSRVLDWVQRSRLKGCPECDLYHIQLVTVITKHLVGAFQQNLSSQYRNKVTF